MIFTFILPQIFSNVFGYPEIKFIVRINIFKRVAEYFIDWSSGSSKADFPLENYLAQIELISWTQSVLTSAGMNDYSSKYDTKYLIIDERLIK